VESGSVARGQQVVDQGSNLCKRNQEPKSCSVSTKMISLSRKRMNMYWRGQSKFKANDHTGDKLQQALRAMINAHVGVYRVEIASMWTYCL
jgi:hypothetical protein